MSFNPGPEHKTQLFANLYVKDNQVKVLSMDGEDAILFTNQCDPIVAAKEFAEHYGIKNFRLFVTTDNTEYVRVL